MVKHLEQAGFAALTALDFSAAVHHLTQSRIQLACIDLGLPSRSGYELCEHIRSRCELVSLPILVTSVRNYPEDMAYAEEAGANAFLKKPFSMNTLLRYVSALLDEAPASRPDVRTLRLAY
jgi:DNA-binding response OmpR family regulator